eukprot:COSAG04_NODE_107_length_25959_cov_6.617865_17_plen_328_part_00
MYFSLLDQSSALLYPSARPRRWRHTCHPARLIRPAPSCPKRRRRKGASWVPLSARAIGRRGGSPRRERPRRRRLCRVAVRVRGFARMLQLLLAEPRLRTVRPTDAHALPPRLVPLRPTHGSLQEIRGVKPSGVDSRRHSHVGLHLPPCARPTIGQQEQAQQSRHWHSPQQLGWTCVAATQKGVSEMLGASGKGVCSDLSRCGHGLHLRSKQLAQLRLLRPAARGGFQFPRRLFRALLSNSPGQKLLPQPSLGPPPGEGSRRGWRRLAWTPASRPATSFAVPSLLSSSFWSLRSAPGCCPVCLKTLRGLLLGYCRAGYHRGIRASFPA